MAHSPIRAPIEVLTVGVGSGGGALQECDVNCGSSRHALRAHVVVVFAPGRALEWKLISASSSLAPGETAGVVVGALEAAEDFT